MPGLDHWCFETCLQTFCGCRCRHAKRLLKYGFDLGPQFSADTNLPPDDGDSMPASVRHNAPSDVILSIADLRNSMHEAALIEDDQEGERESILNSSADALHNDLQLLSPEELQALSSLRPGMFTEGPPGEDLDAAVLDQDTDDESQRSTGDGTQHDAQKGAESSLTPVGSADANAPAASQIQQPGTEVQATAGRQSFDRNMSAMRGSRSFRPQLSSVRFAEGPDQDTGLPNAGLIPGRGDGPQAALRAPPPPDPGGNS